MRLLAAGTYDFGGGARVIAGRALVVVSLDPMGAFRWEHYVEFAASAYANPLALAAGPVDQVTVVGSKNGTIDFGGGNDVGRDGFMLSLGASGAYRWSRVLHPGTKGEGDVRSVAVDATGQITVVGECAGMVDVGSGVASRASFAAAYAADGSYVWDITPGAALAVKADVSNDVIIAGSARPTERRTPAGALVFSVASAQNNGCAGTLCPILPFSISANYDELWYQGGSGSATIYGRRKKSDGSGPEPWGSFPPMTVLGVNGNYYGNSINVLGSGDVVASGAYVAVGELGSWGHLARLARPAP